MKKIRLLIAFLALGSARVSYSQETNPFIYKKFYWGIAGSVTETTISGGGFFRVPTVNPTIRADYYFLKNIGIGIGLGYQMSGAGITNDTAQVPPANPSAGNLSTPHFHLEYLNVPISIRLRTNKLFSALQASGSIGIQPQFMIRAQKQYYDYDNGYHVLIHETKNFVSSDLAYIASAGVDINAGNSCIFQVHLIGQWGSKNVFNSSGTYSGQNGKNRLYGIQIAYLF
jgi:hypothetical protein